MPNTLYLAGAHSAPYLLLDIMHGKIACYSKARLILLQNIHRALAKPTRLGNVGENDEMLRSSCQ